MTQAFPVCSARPSDGTAATFFLLAKIPTQAEHGYLPTQSRAELHTKENGEWDKTSEVPVVHGALRWWALSKAVKPHF
jgi:hypothetical protein